MGPISYARYKFCYLERILFTWAQRERPVCVFMKESLQSEKGDISKKDYSQQPQVQSAHGTCLPPHFIYTKLKRRLGVRFTTSFHDVCAFSLFMFV